MDDVPEIVAKAVHSLSDSPRSWENLDIKNKEKKISRCKVRLNEEAASKMTITLLKESDPNSDIETWLRRVSTMLLGISDQSIAA